MLKKHIPDGGSQVASPKDYFHALSTLVASVSWLLHGHVVDSSASVICTVPHQCNPLHTNCPSKLTHTIPFCNTFASTRYHVLTSIESHQLLLVNFITAIMPYSCLTKKMLKQTNKQNGFVGGKWPELEIIRTHWRYTYNR